MFVVQTCNSLGFMTRFSLRAAPRARHRLAAPDRGRAACFALCAKIMVNLLLSKVAIGKRPGAG